MNEWIIALKILRTGYVLLKINNSNQIDLNSRFNPTNKSNSSAKSSGKSSLEEKDNFSIDLNKNIEDKGIEDLSETSSIETLSVDEKASSILEETTNSITGSEIGDKIYGNALETFIEIARRTFESRCRDYFESIVFSVLAGMGIDLLGLPQPPTIIEENDLLPAKKTNDLLGLENRETVRTNLTELSVKEKERMAKLVVQKAIDNTQNINASESSNVGGLYEDNLE